MTSTYEMELAHQLAHDSREAGEAGRISVSIGREYYGSFLAERDADGFAVLRSDVTPTGKYSVAFTL